VQTVEIDLHCRIAPFAWCQLVRHDG